MTTLPSLGEASRRVAETASTSAWDGLVEAAANEGAKFVLVTDSPADDWDMAAAERDAFLAGLRRLAEEGIAVVWTLDRTETALSGDGLGAIRFVGRTSDHVDLPADGHGPGVRIEVGDRTRDRDGRVVILADRKRRASARVELLDEIAPPAGVSYVAVRATDGVGAVGRRTDGVAVRHAGPLAPVEGHDFGPCGATLAEVDRKGRVDARHVPLCPLRRERIVLEAAASDTPDDLAVRAFEAVAGLEAAACERLWLLRWVVVTAERSASLHTPEVFRRFEHDLASIDPPGSATVEHEVTVIADGRIDSVMGDDLRGGLDRAVASLGRRPRTSSDEAIGEAAEIAAAVAAADREVVGRLGWRRLTEAVAASV